MKSNLVIIGASYLQRPLVRRAKELGYATHVFAWLEGAVCRDIADYYYPISVTARPAILAECRRIRPVGVVSIASEVAAATVNHLAQALGLPGNSRECSGLTGNKYSMRQALRAAGIPGPVFRLAEDIDRLAAPLPYPVIVKPVDRSGSRGVSLVNDARALPDAVAQARAQSFCGAAIIEEYLEGRELSVESISWKGRHHVLQFTDKQTSGPPHFVEVAHYQPAGLSPDEIRRLTEITINALNALQVENGASHSEFKISAAGEIKVVEIGARMGGDCIGTDLVELTTGYDYLKAVIDIATGQFYAPAGRSDGTAGIYYVLPQPGRVRAIERNPVDDTVRIEAMVGIGDEVLPLCDSSQRSGYYIYCAGGRQSFDPNVLRIETQRPG